MKIATFSHTPRSVLLTVLLGIGASVNAQDIPPTAETPVVPLPETPGLPPAESVEETADAVQAQNPDAAAGASQDTAEAPPLPEAEQPAVTRSEGEILQVLKVLSEAEISQAELALDASSSQQTKDAAQQIITEHARTIEQIGALATTTGASLMESPLSAELLERSEATTGDLEALSGTEFECAYLQQKADDHAFALETVDYELLPFAKTFSVRNFLAEAAPRLEQQALAAREMRDNLGSCG